MIKYDQIDVNLSSSCSVVSGKKDQTKLFHGTSWLTSIIYSFTLTLLSFLVLKVTKPSIMKPNHWYHEAKGIV